MAKIRVIIADDHALLREGIKALLGAFTDIEVVGEACDGREAIEKVKALSPHVVLMDIAMPGLGGLEATLEIRKIAPETRILILTQYDNKEYVYRFLKAGAAGYVLKKAAAAELVDAIRATYRGEAFLHPAIAQEVISGFLNHREPGDGDTYESLTDREKQVFKLVAEGYTNREIAESLGISVKTAMAHRTNVMQKLGFHNRTELVKYAIQRGVIRVE
ncbi:MAG: response regulator transcription factor [Candidatus Tectomicrobia bacterium]|uniref:Response regulator transcription factor n=1 Tax=Tectimicrobiota bacterium TaxID=2528274 RepID=A0A932GNB6_UNCTE|nr:response regulator transcription factor [Candidatus Tectomicrobia bacterium]